MSRKEISILIEKFKQDALTEEDKALLDNWYVKYAAEREMSLDPDLLEHNLNLIDASVRDKLGKHGFSGKYTYKKQAPLWPRIAVAASIIMVFGLGFYFIKYGKDKLPTSQHTTSKLILPGGNKAVLVLADGSRISLTDAQNGELVKQSGISISKTTDGQLVYMIVDPKTAQGSTKNTISTPNGGQWQLRLPDGSLVFLNAASSLTYPVSFSAQTNRTVELKGEAYFEVAKDKKHPFLIKTDKQTVEVLGTHFNINSYADDTFIRTTLLEGSVKIIPDDAHKSSMIIKPGEQAILSNNMIAIKNIDADEVMAWKNGYFMFNDEDIESLMKKLSRWYDIDVQFDGPHTSEKFNAVISRSKDLKQVLEILEETNVVQFRLEGRRLIVKK